MYYLEDVLYIFGFVDIVDGMYSVRYVEEFFVVGGSDFYFIYCVFSL